MKLNIKYKKNSNNMKKNIITFICVILAYTYEYNIRFYFCFIFNSIK